MERKVSAGVILDISGLVYPLFSVAAGRLPTPQVVGPLSLSVAGGCCPSGTGRCS